MPKSWLIINASPDETTIEIDGDIGEGWFSSGENTTANIKAQLKEIANLKTKKIIVNINSFGGSVSHGLGIHDALAQHNAEIETNINGLTASAATIIAMAGDVRRMSDNALFLVHQAMINSGGNINDLEEDLQDLKKVNDRLVNIYVKRTGKEETEIRALMDENGGRGKWIDADEAKEAGYIDEIFEPMNAAATRSKISNELIDKNKFPDLPLNFKQMKEEKNAVESIEDMPAKKNVLDKVLDLLKGHQADDISIDQKVEDDIGVEDKVEEKVEETEVTEPETVEPEVVAEVTPEVEPEVIEESPEVIALRKELEDKNTELAQANIALGKKDAKSTNIEGIKGAEDSEIPTSPEDKALADDLKTLQDVSNFKKTV